MSRWSAARGILRALLGGYLEADPALAALRARTPRQACARRRSRQSSASTSPTRGGTALYAVACGREVGVDVEHEDRRVDAVRVARRIFGAQEAERLSALDPISRKREFLRAWVRHEAIVKCLGTGIGAYRSEDIGADVPWVTELEVGPRTVGAVAVSGAALELRCWQWPAGATHLESSPRGRFRDRVRRPWAGAVHRAGLAHGRGPDAGLHERRVASPHPRDRGGALLQPLATRALAQGRHLRQHARGQGDPLRLRRRRAAGAGGAGRAGMPHRRADVLSPRGVRSCRAARDAADARAHDRAARERSAGGLLHRDTARRSGADRREGAARKPRKSLALRARNPISACPRRPPT